MSDNLKNNNEWNEHNIIHKHFKQHNCQHLMTLRHSMSVRSWNNLRYNFLTWDVIWYLEHDFTTRNVIDLRRHHTDFLNHFPTPRLCDSRRHWLTSFHYTDFTTTYNIITLNDVELQSLKIGLKLHCLLVKTLEHIKFIFTCPRAVLFVRAGCRAVSRAAQAPVSAWAQALVLGASADVVAVCHSDCHLMVQWWLSRGAKCRSQRRISRGEGCLMTSSRKKLWGKRYGQPFAMEKGRNWHELKEVVEWHYVKT